MKYSYDESIKLHIKPQEFDKGSSKEILQYAIGGLLYMPATRQKIVDDVINKRHPEFKSICLDLEDAVGDDTISQAETCVKDILTRLFEALDKNLINSDALPLIFIRVRSPQHLKHISKLIGNELLKLITGFCFPKFDKFNCKNYIDEFEKICSATSNNLYFMPILESKGIMFSQHRKDHLLYLQDNLSIMSDRILNIRVGAADFCSLFGIRRSIDDSIYDQKVVADCLSDIINMFVRNYVCAGPVWEYFDSKGVPGKWSEGLKKELYLDKLNGFFGKTCIHPSQLPIVAESNLVSYANYKDAISILGMSDGLVGVQKGYSDNKMNEVKTHATWAKKIACQAAVYGVKEEDTCIS